MKKEKHLKLKEEEEVYFFMPNQGIELTKVTEVNKAQHLATLANKVTLYQTSDKKIGYKFTRPDGKEGYALKVTEETQELYSKFLAYNELKKLLDHFQKKVLIKGYQEQSLTQMQNLINLLK